MSAKILVTEDNPANMKLIVALLKAFGYQSLSAHNGQECLDILAQQGTVDLILMDLQMPQMDGFAAADAIKSNSAWQQIPIVAVTALAMVGDRDKILAAGFDGYIAKPINPRTFAAELALYLKPTPELPLG